MKLGTNIRNWGVTATPACIEACAKHADASTLDSIWLNDHIGLPPTLENNPYGISPDMAHMLDPLGVACFLAAVTSRSEFGIGVLILPYRPPLPTLKWLATIQVLSRNRFLLGTGVGYPQVERYELRLVELVEPTLANATLDRLLVGKSVPLLACRLVCATAHGSSGDSLLISRLVKSPPVPRISGLPPVNCLR